MIYKEMLKTKQKALFLFLGLVILSLPSMAWADRTGQKVNFVIDPSYDLTHRAQITAFLEKTTAQIYFYIDESWWEGLGQFHQQDIDLALNSLATEFEKKIYPTLTNTFGSEPKPGIDGDERITILIHPMKKNVGGYHNSGDVYSRFQYLKSNEREMIYLNAEHIEKPEAKVFLAHEFTHLIAINQKELLRKVQEETWLNEARSEYSATLLGYNEVYQGSVLETRVKDFLISPSDSLVEWQNETTDYATINLFSHYLVDHYGLKILVDSLKSDKVGIESLNYALAKNNYDKNFEDVFADWVVTLLINDCTLGEKFCYLNKSLQDLKITPTLYFLPRAETILSTYHKITYWQPYWQRFVGGSKNLTFEFNGTASHQFKIPYLLCDLKNQCQVDFFILDKEQKGKLELLDFNKKYSSLTMMPFIVDKVSDFDGKEDSFSFSWRVESGEKTESERKAEEAEKEAKKIQQLLAQIEELKKQIAEYQAKIAALLSKQPSQKPDLCQKFDNDLFYGMMQNPEVKCLQELLKAQGPEIYPEGLITGNFLDLTKKAVIRFQERYVSEILAPLNLERGTGYVGVLTRAKLNQLLFE